MIGQFWFYFLGTGIVLRLLTPKMHFKNKTITQFIRRKTQRNIHHLHIGFIFAIVAFFIILIHGINKPLIFFVAMAMSFIADEILIASDFSDYFKRKGLLLSVIGHLTIGVIVTATLLMVY